MKKLDHTGSSFSILIGFLSFFAGVSAKYYNDSAMSIHFLNLGIIIIIGSIIYRSSKIRRHDWNNLHVIRMVSELLGVAAILYLLLGAGVSYLKSALHNDPVWPIAGFVAIFAWMISNMMPKAIGGVAEKDRSKEAIMSVAYPKPTSREAQASDLDERFPLIRPGLYRAEGAEFRLYSSGRIALQKTDIRPLGDDIFEFKSIGWFLRAFPDIDISLMERIND